MALEAVALLAGAELVRVLELPAHGIAVRADLDDAEAAIG